MKISANTVVTMTYVLHRETATGEVIQETTPDKPFEAIFGHGMLLPKFEANLEGKEPGDEFSFPLSPEEGYGVKSDENIIDVNKDMFIQDGKLNEDLCRVGATVWFNTNNGPIPGKVLKIGVDKVTIDFNHELAGVPLYFTGKILDVRMVDPKDFEMGNEGCGCGYGEHECNCEDCNHEHDHEHGHCDCGHCH